MEQEREVPNINQESAESNGIQFDINPSLTSNIIYVGQEKTPVLIIDNLAVNNADIIHYATQQASFTLPDTYYPGVRAELPKLYVNKVLNLLYRTFHGIYNIPSELNMALTHSCYSLVSFQESNLKDFQTIPHIDSQSPLNFAIMHYLGRGKHGGTGFFKHKQTGYERVAPNLAQTYFSSVNQEIENNKYAPSYIKQSNENYELIGDVEYKENRLLVYPANLLHSGLINPEQDISDDPKAGRLTANFFIHFK